MGFLDRAKHQLDGLLDKHGDTVAGGLDKAGAQLNQRTKGKYADQIRKGTGAAKSALHKRSRRGDGRDGLR